MNQRQNYATLVARALEQIAEIFPWDLEGEFGEKSAPLLVDVREREILPEQLGSGS